MAHAPMRPQHASHQGSRSHSRVHLTIGVIGPRVVCDRSPAARDVDGTATLDFNFMTLTTGWLERGALDAPRAQDARSVGKPSSGPLLHSSTPARIRT